MIEFVDFEYFLNAMCAGILVMLAKLARIRFNELLLY